MEYVRSEFGPRMRIIPDSVKWTLEKPNVFRVYASIQTVDLLKALSIVGAISDKKTS